MILAVGDSSVGKSSLLLRFADETWLTEDESSATIGVDFRVHRMQVKGGKKVKLSIWDTAGQERFRTITSSYYRGAQGIILVYDVANRESFDALPRWFSEMETYVSPSVVKIIVGNKLDKEYSRAVSQEEGRMFADRMGTLFLEASAKTAVGVRQAFVDLVEKIIDTPELMVVSGAARHAQSTWRGRSRKHFPLCTSFDPIHGEHLCMLDHPSPSHNDISMTSDTSLYPSLPSVGKPSPARMLHHHVVAQLWTVIQLYITHIFAI
ncbi:hypothetical protein BS47DRAFT_1334604 [Hydnum rufescens UP504]|uniref:Ras-domain-containing protein n=1 Tax=Hydnum rufescens UP504 TaxID=1448309 RepID=A0A9P6DMP4_9AGAM|nr:hypothetical protein BS47DRAFT_1334604 [Hydnum rufescens UP504]